MASRHIWSVHRLRLRERLAIDLLRGQYPADLGQVERAAFAELRGCASRCGLTIHAPGHLHTHADEIRLLAVLAALQRQRPVMEIAPALQDCALICARILDAADIHLDFQATARIDNLQYGRTAAFPAAEAKQPVVRSTPQIKALQFVSDRGTASTSELAAFGISREIVLRMVNHGLLRRQSRGLYSVR